MDVFPKRFHICSLSTVHEAFNKKLTNRRLLMVPRHCRSTFGRRDFSGAGPMEWNSLPHSLKDPAQSTDSFRSALENSSFCGTKGRLAHYGHCVMRYTNRLPLLLLLLLLKNMLKTHLFSRSYFTD